MLDLSIDVPDVSDFVGDIEGLGVALGDLTEPSETAGRLALGSVEAPRDTGRLADSVDVEVTPLGFTLTAGGQTAPYAAIVHARDPFLSRAVLAREEEVVNTYADHVDDTITQHIT